jgi:hypothetical protein
MLTLNVGESTTEAFDERTSEFVDIRTEGVATIELEHSLASLSKWESKWETPFLSKTQQTEEQILDYIKCMVISPGVTQEVLDQMSPLNYTQINDYINSKQTATFIAEKPTMPGKQEVITAEVIYYWMIALNIPLEWENRHIERLFSLIKVCNQKNAPEKSQKVTRADDLARRRAENEARRAKLNSRG